MTDRHGERWAKATEDGIVADALDGASAEVGPPVKSGNCLILKMGLKTYVRDLPGPCSDQDVSKAAHDLAIEAWGMTGEEWLQCVERWKQQKREADDDTRATG